MRCVPAEQRLFAATSANAEPPAFDPCLTRLPPSWTFLLPFVSGTSSNTPSTLWGFVVFGMSLLVSPHLAGMYHFLFVWASALSFSSKLPVDYTRYVTNAAHEVTRPPRSCLASHTLLAAFATRLALHARTSPQRVHRAMSTLVSTRARRRRTSWKEVLGAGVVLFSSVRSFALAFPLTSSRALALFPSLSLSLFVLRYRLLFSHFSHRLIRRTHHVPYLNHEELSRVPRRANASISRPHPCVIS